ncbi:hypothetical protein ACFSKU_00990 [Pontibacter silvestris]|uniref:Uncharacterized protein n=1 Tax=Pontibacter silvestris TaxID=2305183 RepID=A0ABW4WTC5_9BACT|nr:hypothetical protein [Pontibacter silvestris]MCC9136185.1 hypothetical protein [Pontibacter silvestris]
MKIYVIYSIGLMLLAIISCRSLSEGGEGTAIQQNVNQRVRLVDDSQYGLRQHMDNQASEINRKRNIEEFDRNGPAMTPPERRPVLLPHAPVDSTRHNIYWPYNTRAWPYSN